MKTKYNHLDRQSVSQSLNKIGLIKSYIWRKGINFVLNHRLRKNKKKKYYIIKAIPKTGFFSNYFYAIGHMILATQKGYKVTVDWENYKTPYNEEYPINNTLNCWEYFFEQPNNMKTVYESCKNPYISEDKYPYKVVPYYGMANIWKEGVPKKKQIIKINQFIKQYCPFKTEIKDDFDKIAKGLQLDNALGVHMRGTDMNATVGHNKPASIEENIVKIRETLEKNNLERIFLCTDEEAIKERMVEIFGDKVCFVDAYRSQGGQVGIHLQAEMANKRENHRYQLGYEVLRDAYLLSSCRAIVCGKSNVAYAAIVMNNNSFADITYTN